MTDAAQPLSRVYAALADPTRQQIVEWLSTGEEATATELAQRLPVTRQAVSRHLFELADAGILTRHKRGRDVRYRLQPARLEDAAAWLSERAAAWDTALGRLASVLEAEAEQRSAKGADDDHA